MISVKQINDGAVERWQIAGTAAGHPVAVLNDFLVHPISTRIVDVVLDGTFKNAMRHEPLGSALGGDFFGGFAEGQRLGLGKNIGHENIVVAAQCRQWMSLASSSVNALGGGGIVKTVESYKFEVFID